MPKLSFMRKLLKTIHPEGIPWPGATFYNKISSTEIFQRHYELVAHHIIEYATTGNLLDIGTGPARLLLKLHNEAPRLNLTGMDISPAMVSAARRNVASWGLSGTIHIEEGNAASIPFEDETFQAVVSTGTIHHWKDPEAGLNEIYRVLTQGGYALMYDVVSDTPVSVLKGVTYRFGRLRTAFFWIHAFEEPFYSQEEFRLLAQASPFMAGHSRFVGILYCLIMQKLPTTAGEMEAGYRSLTGRAGMA